MSEHNHSTPVGDEEHNEITNNQINENETQNHQENNPFKMEKEKEEKQGFSLWGELYDWAEALDVYKRQAFLPRIRRLF